MGKKHSVVPHKNHHLLIFPYVEQMLVTKTNRGDKRTLEGQLKSSTSKRKLIAPSGKLFCCSPAILLFFAANTFVPFQIPPCLLELTCLKPEMRPRPSLCAEDDKGVSFSL